MTSLNVKLLITIHILPSISRCKGNQKMKFGQLIEYKIKNIFLTKSSKNVIEKTVPDPFLEN